MIQTRSVSAWEAWLWVCEVVAIEPEALLMSKELTAGSDIKR